MINKSIRDGISPLHVASYRGHIKVVHYLLHHGAHIDAQANDSTPLHYAIDNGKIALAIFLIKQGAQVTPNDLQTARQAEWFEEILVGLVDFSKSSPRSVAKISSCYARHHYC